MIDPILDPILTPVRDRLRQQDAAIRSAQAGADELERVANQQRAELDGARRELVRDAEAQYRRAVLAEAECERLRAELASALTQIAEYVDALDVYADVLAAYTDLHDAALAWRTAISVPDGVRAAEERLLAVLERIDTADK